MTHGKFCNSLLLKPVQTTLWILKKKICKMCLFNRTLMSDTTPFSSLSVLGHIQVSCPQNYDPFQNHWNWSFHHPIDCAYSLTFRSLHKNKNMLQADFESQKRNLHKKPVDFSFDLWSAARWYWWSYLQRSRCGFDGVWDSIWIIHTSICMQMIRRDGQIIKNIFAL